MSTLYNLSMGKRSTTYCEAFHTLLFAECDCLYGPTVTHKERAAVDTIAARLNTATAAVVAALNTVRDEAFAVTLHPMLTRTTSDMLPMSFLTDVDCFHPSLLGHRAVATGLWNAMLTPPAQRSDVLDLDAQPTCPPDGAVFRTDFN
jgi:phospholipase B1